MSMRLYTEELIFGGTYIWNGLSVSEYGGYMHSGALILGGGRGVIFLEVYNIHLSFLHDNMFICHNIILVQSES